MRTVEGCTRIKTKDVRLGDVIMLYQPELDAQVFDRTQHQLHIVAKKGFTEDEDDNLHVAYALHPIAMGKGLDKEWIKHLCAEDERVAELENIPEDIVFIGEVKTLYLSKRNADREWLRLGNIYNALVTSIFGGSDDTTVEFKEV